MRTLALLGLCGLTLPVQAGIMDDLMPYMGVSAQLTRVYGHADWKPLLAKSYYGANLFLGKKFTSHFGLEGGYEWVRNRAYTTTFLNGQSFFGVPSNSTFSSRIHSQLSGPFLDCLGYLALQERLELLASLGLSVMQPRLGVSNSSANNLANQLDSATGGHRVLYRFGLGIQYSLDTYVAVRALVRWQGFNRLDLNQSTLPSAAWQLYKSGISFNLTALVKF